MALDLLKKPSRPGLSHRSSLDGVESVHSCFPGRGRIEYTIRGYLNLARIEPEEVCAYPCQELLSQLPERNLRLCMQSALLAGCVFQGRVF